MALAELVVADEAAARHQVEDMETRNIRDCLPLPESQGLLGSAIVAIEAAAWRQRGVFPEGDDLTAPAPLAQSERFGPVPEASLDFTEDPQQVAAKLKHAAEVLRAQKPA